MCLRSLAALATTAMLAACAAQTIAPPAPTPVRPMRYGEAVTVKADPLPLNPKKPGEDRIGAFVFAGTLHLQGVGTSRLHGLSDLKIRGDRLYSISDDGADAFEATIQLSPAGKPLGLTDASLAPLKGADGQPLQGKSETDAEGLAIMPNGDKLYSLERHHRILRYPIDGGPPVAAPMPNRPMGENEGMEGLSAAPRVAPDAYWVGVEDGEIWLCRLSAACEKVAGAPKPPLGYRLSGLTEAPNGDLVLLHHLYVPLVNQSHIQVSVIADPRGKARRVASFKLDPPQTVDNYEGVDVTVAPGGGWRFWLLVDDNFSATEQTLLTAFDWTGAPR